MKIELFSVIQIFLLSTAPNTDGLTHNLYLSKILLRKPNYELLREVIPTENENSINFATKPMSVSRNINNNVNEVNINISSTPTDNSNFNYETSNVKGKISVSSSLPEVSKYFLDKQISPTLRYIYSPLQNIRYIFPYPLIFLKFPPIFLYSNDQQTKNLINKNYYDRLLQHYKIFTPLVPRNADNVMQPSERNDKIIVPVEQINFLNITSNTTQEQIYDKNTLNKTYSIPKEPITTSKLSPFKHFIRHERNPCYSSYRNSSGIYYYYNLRRVFKYIHGYSDWSDDHNPKNNTTEISYKDNNNLTTLYSDKSSSSNLDQKSHIDKKNATDNKLNYFSTDSQTNSSIFNKDNNNLTTFYSDISNSSNLDQKSHIEKKNATDNKLNYFSTDTLTNSSLSNKDNNNLTIFYSDKCNSSNLDQKSHAEKKNVTDKKLNYFNTGSYTIWPGSKFSIHEVSALNISSDDKLNSYKNNTAFRPRANAMDDEYMSYLYLKSQLLQTNIYNKRIHKEQKLNSFPYTFYKPPLKTALNSNGFVTNTNFKELRSSLEAVRGFSKASSDITFNDPTAKPERSPKFSNMGNVYANPDENILLTYGSQGNPVHQNYVSDFKMDINKENIKQQEKLEIFTKRLKFDKMNKLQTNEQVTNNYDEKYYARGRTKENSADSWTQNKLVNGNTEKVPLLKIGNIFADPGERIQIQLHKK